MSRIAHGPESVAMVKELRFKNRFNHQSHDLLNNPIKDRWNAQRPLVFLPWFLDPNPADRAWVVIQYGLLDEVHDLIVVQVQDISHPLPITARSIAPCIGLYSVNGRHDRYRIAHQFEESVEIPFPVPGLLIHLILDVLELGFCFHLQSLNLHSASLFSWSCSMN